MFSSINSKMIFCITLILSVTAVTTMYFTQRYVGKAMLRAEVAAAENVLHLVDLNIMGGYNKLISDKIEILRRLEKELKDLSTICSSVVMEYISLSRLGKLSDAQAQSLALKWITSKTFDKGELFVFDHDGRILSHSNPELNGMSLATLRDLKGRLIVQMVRDEAPGNKGQLAVFSWEESSRKKMGYFIPVPQWDWTLCVTIDFGHIEAESQKQMQNIVRMLRNTFEEIRIAESGFAFLFTGEKKILISPDQELAKDIGIQINLLSNRLLLDDLMASAQSEDTSIRYVPNIDPDRSAMEAHIRYFKAFDWYFAVAVPVSEIQKPAKALVARQSYIIVVISMTSLIIVFFLVSRISRPLSN